tara:strand:+ start:739 stop:1137 length:399 start_codon:yes stop_codon:yes gene_type:complete
MIQIKKKYHFYMGHRNKKAGAKCGRLHGHTYNVLCYFNFNKIDNGLTMLFSDIDKLAEPIIKQFDHWFLFCENDPILKHLNKAGELYKTVPFETSAENMSMFFFKEIKKYTDLPITRIELAETKSSTIIYEE